MKKLLLLSLILTYLLSSAQEADFDVSSSSIRHIEGINALSIGAGYSLHGKNIEFGFSHFYSEKLSASIAVNYEKGKVNLTDYKTIYVPIGIDYTFLNTKEIAYYNVSFGILAGGEYLNNPIKDQPIENFRYGLSFGASTEIYLINRVVLVPSFKQFYEIKSDLGKWHYQINLTLRVSIN